MAFWKPSKKSLEKQANIQMAKTEKIKQSADANRLRQEQNERNKSNSGSKTKKAKIVKGISRTTSGTVGKMLSIRMNNNGWKTVKAKGRTYRSFSSQLAHDFRLEKMDKGYLKYPEREKENLYYRHPRFQNVENLDSKEAMDVCQNICGTVEDKYKENNAYGRGLRSDTKPIITGVISFSTGFDPEEKKEQLHKALCVFVKQEYGLILFGASHLGETSFHYHFITTQVNPTDGSLNKHIDTSLLQDKLQTFLEERDLSFGHTRGVSKEVSNAKHLEIRDAQQKQYEEQKVEMEYLKIENTSLKEVNQELLNSNKEVSKDMMEYFEGFKTELRDWIKLAKTDGMNDFAKLEQMKKLISRVDNYLTKGHFVKANNTIEKIEYHMNKIENKISKHKDKEEELAKLKEVQQKLLQAKHQERDDAHIENNTGKQSHQQINNIQPKKPKPKPNKPR